MKPRTITINPCPQRQIQRLAIPMAWLLAMGAVGCQDVQAQGEKPMDIPIHSLIPAVTVQAQPEYVLEFPILLAVTLCNDTADTDYLDLPELGLTVPIDSLAVDLQPVNGGLPIQVGPSFAYRDQHLFRTQLMVGQTQWRVIDLSCLGQPLDPGEYQLKVCLFNGPGTFRCSPPVPVKLVEPSDTERREAARLRRMGLRTNAVDSGAWAPFLTNNWNTVSLQPLGNQAAEPVSLYLAIHKAIYGPEPLTRLPLKTFGNPQGPVYSPLAALLQYEILAARGDQAKRETARSQMLSTWPHLKNQLDRIDQGQGLLTILRICHGAERELPMPTDHPPYTSAKP